MMWVKYFPYYGTWRKKSEKERQGEKQKQQKIFSSEFHNSVMG